MALDSIFSQVIPPAHGSSGPAPKSANTAASSGGSNSSSSPGIGAAGSGAAGAGAGAQTNAATHSATGSNSSNGKAHRGSGTGSGPTSGSGSGSASRSGSGSGSRGASSSASEKTNSTAGSRSKHGSSQAQSDKTGSTAGTSAGKAAGNKGNAKAQQGDDAPASFLQAMAQTQAAQAAAAQAATAQTTAPQIADTADTDDSDAAPAALGKAKSATDATSDSSSPATLAFMSQSMATAIAGAQQPNTAQPLNAATADSTDEDDSTEAVSLNGGSASAQSLAATLTKQTADALQTATDPTGTPGGSKGDSGTNSAPGADGSSAVLSAFQAHMSVGSHFQQVAPADANANPIGSPVGSPAWNDELGGKVTWLANQGIQSASLQLSPEHLGPVSVHISVQDGAASVSFNAAHADTRAALEQALPHLREMFATNGLTLSDANVSHQSPRGQQQKQAISAIGGVRGGGGEDATSSTVSPVVVARPGLVDTYA